MKDLNLDDLKGLTIERVKNVLMKEIDDFSKSAKVSIPEKIAVKSFKKTWKEVLKFINTDIELINLFKVYQDALKVMLFEDKDFKKEMIEGYNLNQANNVIPDIIFTLGENNSSKIMVEQMIESNKIRTKELRLELRKISYKKNDPDSDLDELIEGALDE